MSHPGIHQKLFSTICSVLDEFSRDRSSSCPEFEQNWIGSHIFWLDEFSITRSSSYPGNLPIRVKIQVSFSGIKNSKNPRIQPSHTLD